MRKMVFMRTKRKEQKHEEQTNIKKNSSSNKCESESRLAVGRCGIEDKPAQKKCPSENILVFVFFFTVIKYTKYFPLVTLFILRVENEGICRCSLDDVKHRTKHTHTARLFFFSFSAMTAAHSKIPQSRARISSIQYILLGD